MQPVEVGSGPAGLVRPGRRTANLVRSSLESEVTAVVAEQRQYEMLVFLGSCLKDEGVDHSTITTTTVGEFDLILFSQARPRRHASAPRAPHWSNDSTR